MYYKYALNTFMKNIKDQSGFSFLNFPDINKYYFYEPSFQFEDRLYKRLSAMNYEDRGDSFICAMFNRSPLNSTPEQARQFKATSIKSNIGGDSYVVKHVKCQTNICWVSNDPEYLTDFEEYFALNYDRSLSYTTKYPIPTNYQSIGDIVNVDTINKRFIIDGEYTLLTGNKIFVVDSSLNNGEYHVVSSNIISGQTIITIIENIPSNLVEGHIYKYDGIDETDVTIFISDIEINEINKLDTQSRGELIFLVCSFNIQYPVILHKSSSGIIKHINFKVKCVPEAKKAKASDMIQPYDEFVIE